MLKPSATDKIRISWDYDESDPWVITVWPGRSMQREPGYRLHVNHQPWRCEVAIYRPNGDWMATINCADSEPKSPHNHVDDATIDAETITKAVGIAASIVEHWDA